MSFLLFLPFIVYHQGRLPVKWTAYEAVMFNTYTTMSDVWVNRNRLEIQFMILKIFEYFLLCLFYKSKLIHFIFSWSYGVVLYEIFTVGKLLFFLINDNGLRRGSFLCSRFWRRSLFEFLYFQVVHRIRKWMARKLLVYFNKNTGCQSHSTWMTNCNSIYFT